ncbi:cytochrome P450 [Sporichthya polymorpha]|uniref:cytochrome P450 n=1 Tax=Sporichthya polymorpha TaxID=35751 RepID=UPI0003691853|nr:cytochrome P450 [Sporichthya polymorpha]
MTDESTGTKTADWSPLVPDADGTYAARFKDMRERCPVAWSDDFGGFWALTKHEDIVKACKDPGTFSSQQQFAVPHLDLGFPWLPLQSDPPDHGPYRQVLTPFLSKPRIQGFEPRLRELARALIEPLRERETFDASEEFAQPFAGEALCLALNIPEDMWSEFRSWTWNISTAFSTGNVPLILEVAASVRSYVEREIKDKTDNPGDDLMSAFLATRINGRSLTSTEIHGYYMLLTSAGHDTSANSLGHALHHLAHHPEHAARLRAEPELIPRAVEEIVRFYGPLIGLGRTCTKDIELRDRTIKAGEQVALVWAAAARDEDQFEDADTFVLDRPVTRSVSFGFGAHYCVGADLGRVQIAAAIREFLDAFSEFAPNGDVVRTIWPTQGFRSIPVRVPAVP